MAVRDAHAVDFIVETLRAEPAGTVTLCTLGPLTNIALAFARAPDIRGRLAGIVAMGGGWSEGGNSTPAAEFNILVDPHAAQAVFHAGVPVVLMPLDVTHKCLTRADRVRRFRDPGSRVGDATAALLEYYERFDEAKYGTDGGPLHDPNVIAWLLRPEIYKGRDVNLEVECGSELTMGQTVVDWWGVTDRPRNVHFVREVDDDAFFALLVERIGRLGTGNAAQVP
jgi:purine nucleosidase